MTEVMVVEIGKDAIFTLLLVVGPLLLVAMIIGLLISLFQTLTQIQEMTLVFVPKILFVFLALVFLLPLEMLLLLSLHKQHFHKLFYQVII